MKVWVTGQGRMVADWLIDHLEESGHEVYRSSWDAVTVERGSWVEVLRSSHADLFIHADELVDRRACRARPVQAAQVNAGGVAVVAQACAEACVPLLLLSTSAAREGQSMYGLSKLWGEQAATLFAQRTGVQIVRLHNVYGADPRRDDGVSAPLRMLRTAEAGDVITASPDHLDSYLHVTDAVDAVRLIAEDGRPGSWNVASREVVAQTELAAAAVEVVGRGGLDVLDGIGGVTASLPDTAALLALGWQQLVGLSDGLLATAERLGIRRSSAAV